MPIDPALVSQIANVLIMVVVSYGAVYFGQYKGLVKKMSHLEIDLKAYLTDNIVSPDEVADLQADLEDLQAEFKKINSA